MGSQVVGWRVSVGSQVVGGGDPYGLSCPATAASANTSDGSILGKSLGSSLGVGKSKPELAITVSRPIDSIQVVGDGVGLLLGDGVGFVDG